MVKRLSGSRPSAKTFTCILVLNCRIGEASSVNDAGDIILTDPHKRVILSSNFAKYIESSI